MGKKMSSKKRMFLSTKVHSNLKIKFMIHNVPFTKLDKNEDSYSLTFKGVSYKLQINLIEAPFHFIENSRLNKAKKKSRNYAPFSISRNDEQTIDLGIQINASTIIEHNFNQGPLLIEEHSKNRGSFTVEIKPTPIDLLKKIKQAKEQQQIQKQQQQKEKNKKQKKKERINELLKKFDELEAKHRESLNNQEKELKAKGIYLAHPAAFKRCENCANNTGSKCSVHKVDVSENHRCSRFYSYKTVYGGGFSPK